jgi:FkbM family methyltransferase
MLVHTQDYTLISAKIVGDVGKVIAVKPHPFNLKYLTMNVRLNDLNNVIIVPKAADKDCYGYITLYYEDSRQGFTSYKPKERLKTITVPKISIDEIIHEHAIKIMKVDTEGMDMNVLLGAQSTLRRTHYVIVEQNTADVRRLLKLYGFKLKTLKPSGYLCAHR